jgi:hypothetical protein
MADGFCDAVGELLLQRDAIQVGGVDRHTGHGIEILPARLVVQAHPFTVGEGDRLPARRYSSDASSKTLAAAWRARHAAR